MCLATNRASGTVRSNRSASSPGVPPLLVTSKICRSTSSEPAPLPVRTSIRSMCGVSIGTNPNPANVAAELGEHPLAGFAQVCAPRAVRRTHPAAVDPIAVGAVPNQVALPAVLRHRRDHLGGCVAPARRIRVADVLLRRRPQRQQAVGVSLAPGPIPSGLATVDQHNTRHRQAGSGERTGLRGDRNALRAGADDSKHWHLARITTYRRQGCRARSRTTASIPGSPGPARARARAL